MLNVKNGSMKNVIDRIQTRELYTVATTNCIVISITFVFEAHVGLCLVYKTVGWPPAMQLNLYDRISFLAD